MQKQVFLKIENPPNNYITHEDKEKHNLKFRVFYNDKNISIFLIKGEDKEIENFKKRFKKISELSDSEMQSEMDNYVPAKEITCPYCNGTGKIITPRFDLTKAKNVFVEETNESN